jgi:hypothetical protein
LEVASGIDQTAAAPSRTQNVDGAVDSEPLAMPPRSIRNGRRKRIRRRDSSSISRQLAWRSARVLLE